MRYSHNSLEGARPELVIDTTGSSLDELISIIIVCKDRPEYLNICLQSIVVMSINNNYEIIIVDNGSEKKTQDFLDQLETKKAIKVVRNERNLWWAKAANIGAKVADKNSKYFVFLHPDTVIEHPTWLDLMIGVSQSSEKRCGLVGSELSHYEMDGKKIEFVNEWCMLISRECWKECGPFNEDFPQVGASFLMTYVAQHKNWNPQAITAKLAHHYKIGIDVSAMEKFVEAASLDLPKHMKHLIESLN